MILQSGQVFEDAQADCWVVGDDYLLRMEGYPEDDGLSYEAVQSRYNPLTRVDTVTFPTLVTDKADNRVNHPSHYTWLPAGVEVIDITARFSFVRGNALKYLMRADHKGQKLQDLKKARWYIDYEIRGLKEQEAA